MSLPSVRCRDPRSAAGNQVAEVPSSASDGAVEPFHILSFPPCLKHKTQDDPPPHISFPLQSIFGCVIACQRHFASVDVLQRVGVDRFHSLCFQKIVLVKVS